MSSVKHQYNVDMFLIIYIYYTLYTMIMTDKCRCTYPRMILVESESTRATELFGKVGHDNVDTHDMHIEKQITTRSPCSMNDDHQISQLDLLFVLTNYHFLQSSFILYVSIFCFIKWGKEKRYFY